jgi:hypothetical protein
MPEAYIVDAIHTPVGPKKGALAGFPDPFSTSPVWLGDPMWHRECIAHLIGLDQDHS